MIFYVQFTANELSCARFEAYRWFPIANSTIQHEIRVYDFYEPGNLVDTDVNNTCFVTMQKITCALLTLAFLSE